MSLSTGRNILRGAIKDLHAHWDYARQSWRDSAAEDLERIHLTPLDPKVRTAMGAMERLMELVSRARRECE